MDRSTILCAGAFALALFVSATAQMDSEDVDNVRENIDFVGGPSSDAFPNSKAETSSQQDVAVYCGLGTYNASSPGATDPLANFEDVLYGLTYVCGQNATNATNSAKLVAKAGNPDTSQGTPAPLRALLGSLVPLQTYSLICNVRNASIFLEVSKLVGGLGYLIQGGYPAKATYIEQFLKPTPLEIATKEIARLQGKPKTLALGSDTMVIVSQLGAPAPPTTALFLFHATIGNNFCNWATDFNYFQVPYPTPKGLSDCKGCKVHEGFLAAFNSVTNVSSPSSNILEAWEELSGVPAEQVTDVVCGGHSLGAAIATLCGPWAKSHFPNAKTITVYHSGSPRVFSPEAVDWWSAEIGLNNSYRVVNNQDVIPSLPPVVIPGRGNFGLPLKFEHVGSPIWMYRIGRFEPGNYTGYAEDRPALYTGRIYDHIHAYILGLRQIANCNF